MHLAALGVDLEKAHSHGSVGRNFFRSSAAFRPCAEKDSSPALIGKKKKLKTIDGAWNDKIHHDSNRGHKNWLI